ncbi:hypothetical protein PVAND_011412 [Polypedilum vanderplanki]|uniref:Protein quiver n=1 Tax=Polypedilum vanderplanki TaxID=319348 RepID=A0A9J6CJ45_POLVA|nr:hypothetical protein PVAND_011412 [Polypedilum vanderplanki]
MLLLFVVYLVLFTKKFACTENAITNETKIQCYVCGIESLAPLIELNQTFASMEEKSCEQFDKLSSYEREAHEIQCPRSFSGCITKIQSNNVMMRTCFEKSIDDCKKVNGDFICICSKKLCNGEISDNIKKMLVDEFNPSEEEDDNEEGDDDIDEENFVESGDDAIQFAEDTTNIIDSSSTTNAYDEVLMSTMRPSTNKAVTFHFKNQLKLFYVLIFLHSQNF